MHRCNISMRFAVGASAGAALIALLSVAGCGGGDSTASVGSPGLPTAKATMDQVTLGRGIVATSGCADCHGQGKTDPTSSTWLAGYIGAAGGQGTGTFNLGPFQVYAANLTPDATDGLGAFSDRQVFNALKYGLDPGATPDVVISGTTPGQGNFPATPHYLAPVMPWASIRHHTDDELWAIVAYLKHGIKPVANVVPESQSPPDFWASSSTEAQIGPANLAAYPTGNEQFNP